MTAKRHNHWTDDDDLLERYVQRMLPDDEIVVMKEHVDQCERCAARVRSERIVAGASKQYGKDRLKQELHTMIARRRLSRRQTLRWLSAAAVVLVGVGFWKFLPPAAVGEKDRADKTASEGVKTVEVPRSAEESGSRADDEDGTVRQPETHLTIPGREGLREPRREFLVDRLPSASGSAASGAAQPAVHLAATEPDLWTEALPVTDSLVEIAGADMKGDVAEQRERAIDTGLRAARPAADKFTREESRRFELRQELRSQLPLPIDRQAVMFRPDAIPALVRTSDRQTLITLYVQALLPADTLRAALVRQTAAESLEVTVSGQLYRIYSPTRAVR